MKNFLNFKCTHFHSCFFLTSPFKFFIQKVVHQGLFVTYLYVYVYDNNSKDNNTKIISFQSHHTRILNAGLGKA